MLEFGGPNSKKSENSIDRTDLVSEFNQGLWKETAHFSRFFVFPFSKGSDASKPDVVALTWKVVDNTKKPVIYMPCITVASTETGLVRLLSKTTSRMYPPSTFSSLYIAIASFIWLLQVFANGYIPK